MIENYEREQRKTCRYHESTFTQSDNPEKHGPKVILALCQSEAVVFGVLGF